jgi:chloride channel protein, CIC family
MGTNRCDNMKVEAWRRRIRFVLALCVTAVAASLFAVSFRSLLAFLYGSAYGAHNVVDAIASLKWWMRLLVPMVAATGAGMLARLRGAQGVSNVMEAVALGNVQLSLRTTLSRVAASWVAIAGGMSIGREGPLIEFGGTAGATLARTVDATLTHTRVLVAAGTAAGFASAYNTPFAAILFVFETIVGIAAPEALLPTITATVIATTLTRAVAGAGPIYGARSFGSQSPADLLWFAILGIVAAFVAFAFKRLLESVENVFDSHPIPQPLRASIGGAIVGAIAVVLPEVAGNGYEPLNVILDQQMVLGTIAVLICAKVFGTSASVGSGVPGGIFTPTLLLGAGTGTLFSAMVAAITGSSPDAGSYALVGMAAATAATIHAPITAAVLVFELSGDYAIVLPLLLATVLSTAMSRAMGSASVYERELRRRGLEWQLTLEGRRMPAGQMDQGAVDTETTPRSV